MMRANQLRIGRARIVSTLGRTIHWINDTSIRRLDSDRSMLWHQPDPTNLSLRIAFCMSRNAWPSSEYFQPQRHDVIDRECSRDRCCTWRSRQRRSVAKAPPRVLLRANAIKFNGNRDLEGWNNEY